MLSKILNKTTDRQKIFAKAIGGTFSVNVAGLLTSFLMQLALTRNMGEFEYGQYAYVIGWVNILSILFKAGLDIACIKHVPSYLASENGKLAIKYIHNSSKILALISISGATIFALTILFSYNEPQDNLKKVFYLGACLLPIICSLQFNGAISQAFKKPVISQTIQNIYRPGTIAALVITIALITQTNLNATIAISLNIIVTLILLLLLKRKNNDSIKQINCLKNEASETQSAQIFSTIAGLFLITFFNQLINQTDLICVGSFLDTTQAGIYSVSSRLGSLIQFSITASNLVAAPLIAELYTKGKLKELDRIINLGSIIVLSISIPILLIIVLFGKNILGLYGEAFTQGYYPLIVLCGARFMNALFGFSGYMLSMTNNHMLAAKILGFCAAINLVGNYYFINQYGMIGASYSSFFSAACWGIIMSFFVYRKIGINPTIFRIYLKKNEGVLNEE